MVSKVVCTDVRARSLTPESWKRLFVQCIFFRVIDGPEYWETVIGEGGDEVDSHSRTSPRQDSQLALVSSQSCVRLQHGRSQEHGLIVGGILPNVTQVTQHHLPKRLDTVQHDIIHLNIIMMLFFF